MVVMRLRAPAKINLSLEVLGRRPDGYHEVRSVLQAVDLADWVEIEEADALTLHVEPEGAAPAEENLVLNAAQLLRGATGATRGAAITLRKQIPVAAGLGGGSSDAAAALLGLGRLWALDLDQAQLGALAARLGSDVPFFLGGATALASGRGEQLEELPAPVERFAVIVTPTTGGDERKTARMYGLLDSRAYSDGSRTAETARRIHAGEPVGRRAVQRIRRGGIHGIRFLRGGALVAHVDASGARIARRVRAVAVRIDGRRRRRREGARDNGGTRLRGLDHPAAQGGRAGGRIA